MTYFFRKMDCILDEFELNLLTNDTENMYSFNEYSLLPVVNSAQSSQTDKKLEKIKRKNAQNNQKYRKKKREEFILMQKTINDLEKEILEKKILLKNQEEQIEMLKKFVISLTEKR